MENQFNNQDIKYLEAKKQVKKQKGFYIHALVYVCVNLFLIYSNAVLEHQGFADMDNYWTAIFWGIGLFFHGLSVFGQNIIFGKDWEERKIKELINKDR